MNSLLAPLLPPNTEMSLSESYNTYQETDFSSLQSEPIENQSQQSNLSSMEM